MVILILFIPETVGVVVIEGSVEGMHFPQVTGHARVTEDFLHTPLRLEHLALESAHLPNCKKRY